MRGDERIEASIGPADRRLDVLSLSSSPSSSTASTADYSQVAKAAEM
jgi:hypothetical protein